MKKIAILFITAIAFIGFNACDDEDELVFTAKPDPQGVNFTNSFSPEYILTVATGSNLAERFVWNEANFDTPTNISYELHGSADINFEVFTVIGTTTTTELGVTVNQMRNLATEAGLDDDPETPEPNTGEVHFRLRAYAGSGEANGVEQFSGIETLTITLLEDIGEEVGPQILRQLFLTGNATAAGSNNDNNNTPLFRDPSNEDIYYFRGYFAASEFNLIEVKGESYPLWGTNDGVTLAVDDGTGVDPNPFEIVADGYYDFEVNLSDGTFSLSAYGGALDEYTSIGIMGSGRTGDGDGWNDPDTDMVQSAFDPHIWYASGVTLYDGELKFRADDDWAVNWGGDTELSGQGAFNGPNIPVIAATYDIWFNDLDGRYVLIPTE